MKLDADDTGGAYALGETIAPPGGGPPPHVHHREDELFYIIEGDFAFVLGNQRFRGGPGTTAFLPRGVVHTFKNVGSSPGRFLVLATPAGFGGFVAEAGCACTDRNNPPPLDDSIFGKLMAMCPKYGIEMRPEHQPTTDGPAFDRGTAYWCLGEQVNVRLTGAQTGGVVTIAEVTTQPGRGVPPHRHRAEDEIFYVLEGTYEFCLDGNSVPAPAGTVVRVGKGVLHGFRNVGTGPAKLLDYHTPGGFDRFFAECGTPCTDMAAGPPAAPVDEAFIARMVEKHGMEMP
jgi:quercetin dioxygenase-like cupin family protein